MKNKSPASYTGTAKSFHWLIAALIIVMLGVGLYMTGMALTPAKFTVYQLHKSVGLTILILVFARLMWRITHPAPMLPKSMPGWQKAIAHVSHYALYALMFAMPLSGWIFSDAAGYHPSLFGLTVPVITQMNPQVSNLFREVHEYAAYLLIFLLIAHIGAALHHHLIVRDDILTRIAPSNWKLPRPRLFILAAVLSLAAPLAHAQVWNINPTASNLTWIAKFNGQPVNGRFKNWFGKIFFDPKNLTATAITITIATNSVSSGEMGRDQTLQSPDWFSTQQFPNAVFTTTNVISTGPETYLASGTLSLAGITRPLQFPFKLTIAENKARANGSFSLSRSAFNVGKGVWQTNTEIADAVSVSFVVNAVKQQ